METLLILVTAIALAMALGLAIVVVKLVGDDRKRSEARVAALTAMSGAAVPPPHAVEPAPAAAVASPPPIARPAAPRVPALPHRLADLEIRPGQREVVGFGDLFVERDQPSPWGRRLAVIGALAAVVLAIGFGLVSSNGARTATPAPQAAVKVPAVAESVPLELVSLRHLQQAQTLTVTGLVQNPRTAAPLSHVVATAFVFGPDGTFLSSSRAPLDFTTLGPGDESPFVVTVPVTGVVSRYRIGFRSEDGRVIAHVDKRGPDALAGLR
jgi:hypothetical protein